VADVTLAEIQCVWEVSYLGTVYGMLAAYRRMRPRNRGVIIQVGSALAYRSIPLQAPYRAAKAAVRGFTDSLRCGLIHEASGVRVAMAQLPAVNPPQFTWVRSHMSRHPHPVAPVFQPEVIGEAISIWKGTDDFEVPGQPQKRCAAKRGKQ
jgi:NAD(P)-dependent dehydrogenase (short-subunit alcohol dehydrogenase family)